MSNDPYLQFMNRTMTCTKSLIDPGDGIMSGFAAFNFPE